MKAKHLIAIFTLLALSVTIFAGCTIGERPTTFIPRPLAAGEHPDQWSAEQRAEWMERYGLGEDMMLPPPPNFEWIDYWEETAPTYEDRTVMPEGVRAEDAEVLPMLRNTVDIFGSGRFYLRGITTVPESELAPASTSPIAMASNGDRAVFEQSINWIDMFQSDGFNFQARIQAATFNGMFGSQMRMIIEPAGMTIAFPQRNVYLSIADLVAAAGEEMPAMMDMDEFDLSGIGALEIPNNLQSTRVTAGGRDYLTATIPNEDEGTNTIFFFHNGQLARLETHMPDGNVSIIEVHAFSGSPPDAMFSTQGLSRMPMAQIMSLMEGLGGGDGEGGLGGLFG